MVVWKTVNRFNAFTNSGDEFMYNKNSDKDLVSAVVTAGLGAGVVTSFAVSQGQHPLVALQITIFAVLVALLCDRLGLI
ncbi:hypothetical protein IQ264_16095 [Phormidium sp. LEGE 05292]|uniref:hypothetical protein n=1 Tax=[Phormidium] sp. LEGE 05292 TaxID=767427 RepID=UPI0018800D1A|nr:hypothetical protein [Phormidium sp. LEGE 05292]MBE9226950.1 hypothetical protein [Phormidium sp. LEGE 05292]